MTFDESNAEITNALTGRQISHIVRNGKILEFYTEDGHVVKLQADVNGDIHYHGTDVKIMLTGVTLQGQAGQF